MHKLQRKLAPVIESSWCQKYDFVNSLFSLNASKKKLEIKNAKNWLRVDLRVRLCEISFHHVDTVKFLLAHSCV